MFAVRTFRAAAAGLVFMAAHAAGAGENLPTVQREVLQPVHQYSHLKDTIQVNAAGAFVLNGFTNYTHLGTDFGFLGSGAMHVTSEPVAGIRADLSATPGSWGGVWHSLNELARQKTPMRLASVYPALIKPEFQPRVIGVQAVASGRGKLKLELIGPAAASQGLAAAPTPPVWTRTFELQGGDPVTLNAPVDAAEVPVAQFLNWVAEPGSDLCVDSISLRLQMPDVDYPAYVFLASYAKLARCYNEQSGFVRDRAHIGPESLNNVAATGMFALATAAAADVGIVSKEDARAVVERTMRAIHALPRKQGLLPHFVAQREGAWVPLPEAEYSTIDTALTLMSLRAAANAINDHESAAQALEILKTIDMANLRDEHGYVIHGVHPDGRPIPFVWKDWGGETALVLMMQRIAAGSSLTPMMDESGVSHRGIGFITEIPALFFPQYNTNARARAGSVDWRAYRQKRLAEQKEYFVRNAPQSVAAQLGLYGLSAGEGARGIGYLSSGTEDAAQHLIYPHYILMSALMEPNAGAVYDVIKTLECNGWFTPWGLVENFGSDGKSYVPMISSLNASFESLASYHLLMAYRGESDALYDVAAGDPVFKDALEAVFE